MALQKSIVSARTGVALGYHDVMGVQFGATRVDVLVARYLDAAAKQAGKSFLEMAPFSFDYDGSPIAGSVNAFAQAKLLTLPEFAGATEVA